MVIAKGRVRGWKEQETPDGPGEYDSELTIDIFELAPWDVHVAVEIFKLDELSGSPKEPAAQVRGRSEDDDTRQN